MALGADIRIAGPDTKIAVMELKWGIVPDMGGMVLLPKLVAPDVMRKLTYTATPVLADQALAWGLVTELAEADAHFRVGGHGTGADLAKLAAACVDTCVYTEAVLLYGEVISLRKRRPAKRHEPVCVIGLRLHVLTHDGTYDIPTRRAGLPEVREERAAS